MGRTGDLNDNVELVRRFYAAFNEGDLDRLMALCGESVEYVNPPDAAETGTRRGQPAFRRALGRLSAGFEDFQIEVQTITPIGDQVVVVTKSSGRGRASGIPFSVSQSHILQVRAGRIVSFKWFREAEQAQAALNSG